MLEMLGFTDEEIEADKKIIRIDDFDIYTCLKYRQSSDDFVLSNISKRLINRQILKIKITNTIPTTAAISLFSAID